MEIFDNVNKTVKDDLTVTIEEGSIWTRSIWR
jgi:hypothetical protein